MSKKPKMGRTKVKRTKIKDLGGAVRLASAGTKMKKPKKLSK